MAHKVMMWVDERRIEKNGVHFTVSKGGSLLGQLYVSQGGLKWTKRGGRSSTGVSWEQFAKWVKDDL